jgi:hypothetical protein
MPVQETPLPSALDPLQSSVQRNCHISDARFASDFTLCVYLLKMREYYRWEKDFPYDAPLPNDQVGNWLVDREALWETLAEETFQPVALANRQFDPFDTESINDELRSHELVYSAGYGNKAKPHFFLAQLEKTIDHPDYRIFVSAREYARDLTAPPAMSLNGEIFVRRESLRRMLWERLEEWRWNKPDNAMGRAIRCYDFDGDLESALEQMTEAEIDTLVLHEIGEVEAGAALGNDWREMLASFPRSRLELLARAVKDHLADCMSTLPALLQQQYPPSLHFYFANLSGIRKQIYPTLLHAYDHWVKYNDPGELQDQVEAGKDHWMRLARQLVEIHSSRVKTAWQDMESLIESKLL